MILDAKWKVGEIGEVEMFFAILYVVIEPVTDRLDGSIPRIIALIGVAIVASAFEDSLDIVWDIVAFG
jgi:hypothetical protein